MAVGFMSLLGRSKQFAIGFIEFNASFAVVFTSPFLSLIVHISVRSALHSFTQEKSPVATETKYPRVKHEIESELMRLVENDKMTELLPN
jgi:hypothetical protein